MCNLCSEFLKDVNIEQNATISLNSADIAENAAAIGKIIVEDVTILEDIASLKVRGLNEK